jgi:hypothetical protein
MKTNIIKSEFELYDGERFITFNIVDIDTEKKEITLAVTKDGGISVVTLDLKIDGNRFFFEYGVMQEEIAVDDFEQLEQNEEFEEIEED